MQTRVFLLLILATSLALLSGKAGMHHADVAQAADDPILRHLHHF